MKRTRKIAAAIFLTIIALVPTILVLNGASANVSNQSPFYVGVTYCGSSIQEAKELIDKVKDYTNLFTLLSGTLQSATAMEEIGDYAVASKLNFIVFNSRNSQHVMRDNELNIWLNSAKERWGEQFIGLYYYDEPGGNMLDKSQHLRDVSLLPTDEEPNPTRTMISKGTNAIFFSESPYFMGAEDILEGGIKDGADYINVVYYFDGRITFEKRYREVYVQESESLIETDSDLDTTSSIMYFRVITDYYPNGTINIEEHKGDGMETVTNFYTAENITEYSSIIYPYDQVLKENPIQNYDDVALEFVNMNKDRLELINKKQLNEADILVFTADYGLYWWDYQGGYDVVLAELAWNHSVAQHIGLARGAANLQGKSWGTCITWKYTQLPFLTDGEEMFEQMKISYEAGAEYVIIFNYSEDPANPNTLQEEHFLALERFWNEVVQNPDVTHGGIKAEAVLVLPQNYGWGMRAKDDNIWGIWSADEATVEIWNQMESKIDQYGVKLDIVFKDPNYPVTGKYGDIYYCDSSQTMFSDLTEFFTSFYVWVIMGVLLLSVMAGALLICFRWRKK